MVRTAPDYSNVRSEAPLHRLDDMAELAARLGSIATFDRAGRIVWLDDFSKGLGSWITVTNGTGADVSLVTTYPEFPPFCVLMTGGADDQRLALLIQYFAPQELSKLGTELSAGFYSDWDVFSIIMYRFDGTTRYEASVRLDYGNSRVDIKDHNGVWQKIADLPNLRQGNGCYHKIKLVADFENNVYHRLVLNQRGYKITEYAMQESASGQGEHFQLHVSHVSRAGWNDAVRVDGVVITQNEP